MLVVGTSLSLQVMLPAKVCRLDGVVCLKQIRRSVDAVILGSARDLRLIALSLSIGWVQPLSASALLLVSTGIGNMLLDLILASTFFGDYWKWRVDVVVATLPYGMASGVVGGRRPTLPLASFLHLGVGDTDVSQGSAYRRSIWQQLETHHGRA